MLGVTLGVFLLAQAGSTAPAEVRSLTISVTDEKGEPVEGLQLKDVALLENGVARDVTAFAPDRRPLYVAVLVDTSAAVASVYRLNVVDAVVGFISRLPADSRYALWTTGDRPFKVLDYTDDRGAARAALSRVAPQGGNTLLDALVEASEDLKKKEGERSAVVAVTGLGIEFSHRDRFQVVEQARRNADVFQAVEIDIGSESFESRAGYAHVLDGLTRRTGGLYETVLSAMGAEVALRRLAGQLNAQYRLSYATLPELKSRKLEVAVARPGARVRIGSDPFKES